MSQLTLVSCCLHTFVTNHSNGLVHYFSFQLISPYTKLCCSTVGFDKHGTVFWNEQAEICALREKTAKVQLEIEEGAPHVWHHLTPDVPEANAALARAGAFIAEHAG